MRNTTSPGVPTQRQSDFHFFGQQSIVPNGPAPGGPTSRPGLQQEPKTNVMMHNSTDAFEKSIVLQQLQQDPVDPFDPVLFNRQYHSQRLKENGNQ
jgi:hypothetical protein